MSAVLQFKARARARPAPPLPSACVVLAFPKLKKPDELSGSKWTANHWVLFDYFHDIKGMTDKMAKLYVRASWKTGRIVKGESPMEAALRMGLEIYEQWGHRDL